MKMEKDRVRVKQKVWFPVPMKKVAVAPMVAVDMMMIPHFPKLTGLLISTTIYSVDPVVVVATSTQVVPVVVQLNSWLMATVH